MRKSDKKIDNNIRVVLTDVCDIALETIDGFQWLTHLVNYADFPNSLKVICIFDTNDSLSSYIHSQTDTKIVSLIKDELGKLDIKLKNIEKHVSFDTEENCTKQHDGNWAKRLSS